MGGRTQCLDERIHVGNTIPHLAVISVNHRSMPVRRERLLPTPLGVVFVMKPQVSLDIKQAGDWQLTCVSRAGSQGHVVTWWYVPHVLVNGAVWTSPMAGRGQWQNHNTEALAYVDFSEGATCRGNAEASEGQGPAEFPIAFLTRLLAQALDVLCLKRAPD